MLAIHFHSPSQALYAVAAKRAAPLLTRIISDVASLGETADPPQVLGFLGDWLRLADPALPSGVDPIRYYAQQARLMLSPRLGWTGRLPNGAVPMFRAYREFLRNFVQSHGIDPAITYIEDALGADDLSPQLAHMTHDEVPPAAFHSPGVAPLLDKWTSICGDWDQLIKLPYVLMAHAVGKPRAWSSLSGISLHDRAVGLRANSEVARLAPDTWIAVRNALAHGNAHFDPSTKLVVFSGRNRTLRMSLPSTRKSALLMTYANLLMARTLTILIALQILKRPQSSLFLAGGIHLTRDLVGVSLESEVRAPINTQPAVHGG